MNECKLVQDGICSDCINPELCEMFIPSENETGEQETTNLDDLTPELILNRLVTEREQLRTIRRQLDTFWENVKI